MDFEKAKQDLLNARKAWYNGTGTRAAMDAAAETAAGIYNAKAKEIAKRFGQSPRLVAPSKIMRSIDRSVRL